MGKLFTDKEALQISRALANAIQLLLDYGDDPDDLAVELGLTGELKRQYLDIHKEDEDEE